MSIWVTLRMPVKTGAYPELEPFLEAKLPAVRGFDGALSVSVFYEAVDGELLILEEWKSRAHHEAYIAAITENGVMAQLAGFMAAAPQIAYFCRLEI